MAVRASPAAISSCLLGAMFRDDDDDDDVDGDAGWQEPSAQMSYRQQNMLKARSQRRQARATCDAPLAASVAEPEDSKTKAARALLTSGLRTSLKAFSDRHGVDFKWARRLLMISGSVILEKQRAEFRRLLVGILASKGADVRARLFSWLRSYDETPRLCRVSTLNVDGSLESEASHAKIMCAFLRFSMTLELRIARNPDVWRSCIIHGALGSELLPVANQTIPFVAKYISEMLSLPDDCEAIVTQAFDAQVALRSSDMHTAYTPAERANALVCRKKIKQAHDIADSHVNPDDLAVSQVAHAGPADMADWCVAAAFATAFFRCSMHRCRSSEKSFLSLDDSAESFLMNFTLNLSHNDILRLLRQQLNSWATSPQVLIWRRSSPSPELQEWRQRMEALLFCGPPSKAKARRKLFWQRVQTGDPRKKGIIEHLCPGDWCCKTRADLESKVRGAYGVQALFNPPPKRWPRKSWSGQSEQACHILQCELSGGLISAHLPVIAKMAAKRAKQASERVRVAASRADQENETREDVANERARALWAETQAQEESSGCGHAMAFLTSPDAMPRLISLVVTLETYRTMKSTILTRNGEQWGLTAMADVVPGAGSRAAPRKMIIKEAVQGQELLDAMISSCRLLADVGAPGWCLVGVAGVSPESSVRRWVMVARAGGGAFLCWLETQRYPWRLFFLFSYDPKVGAKTFAEEAQRCKHQCFLGELARLHWQRYPSVEALLSEAALADIDSMAELLTDNTALLEGEHAGGKRSARSREDTYLEHVMDSSALRMVKKVVEDSKRWPDDVLAAAEAARKANQTDANAVSLGVAERPAKRRRANANAVSLGVAKRRPPPDKNKARKPRKIDSRNAWVRANVSGRLATAEDYAKYSQDMENPRLKAHYVEMAKNMTAAAKRAGHKRKRARDLHMEQEMRNLRQAARRAKKAWDPKRARAHVQRSATYKHKEEARRSAQQMRKASAQRMREHASHREKVCGYSKRARLSNDLADSQVAAMGLSREISESLVPVPHSGVDTYLWRPPSCRQAAAIDDVLNAMKNTGAEKRLAGWERVHAKMTQGWQGKIPAFSEVERTRGICEKWCRCLCGESPGDSHVMLHMTMAFGRGLFEVMGVVHGRKNNAHAKSEARLVVEAGSGIVRLYNSNESHWLQVAFPNFAAGGLPILLLLKRAANSKDLAFSKVAQAIEDPSSVCLQVPSYYVDADNAGWCEAMDFFEELPRTEEWLMQLFRLRDVWPDPEATSDATRLMAQPLGEAKQWWDGEASVERAKQEPLPAVHDDGAVEDAAEEADDVPPDDVAGAGDAEDGSGEDIDGVDDEFEGEHAPARLARESKRAKKGMRVSCVACRAAGREVLTYLLTYKKASEAGRKASYQMLCDYHEPDTKIGRDGKVYRLPCRKTRKVEEDTLESECDAIRWLVRWVRRGPCAPASRTKHLEMLEAEFADVSTSSDDEDDAGSAGRDSPGAGSTAASRAAVPSSSAKPACWVCGETHGLDECVLWQLTLQESILANVQSLRPLGHVSRKGVRVPRTELGCKDVPGDGDCLFHSIGREIADNFRRHLSLPGPDPTQGGVWRSWLLHYIRTTADEIDGSSIAEWTALVTRKTVEEYTESMTSVRGPETWGGFLEASLIVHAWGKLAGEGFGCLMLSLPDRFGDATVMAWLGDRAAPKQLGIIWSGNHWLRARLTEAGWARLRAAEL